MILTYRDLYGNINISTLGENISISDQFGKVIKSAMLCQMALFQRKIRSVSKLFYISPQNHKQNCYIT